MNIIIAEDELVTRNLLAKALKTAGYDVTAVADGKQALDELRRSSTQLVISDWEMPNLNGIELCRAIRSGDFDRYIYLIMLTSHDRPEDVVQGLEAGADDFVKKPFNPAEIIVRIRGGQRLLSIESTEMTIFAMARLAESRDPETGAHLERVRGYCRVLAEYMMPLPQYEGIIDTDYARLIFQTSPLHDIGKIAIPDCVLLKAARLSDEEFDIMKTHTSLGAATLESAMKRYPNARFLRMARDIALTHHEKFDGRGYPNGLAGASIPLCGRIVALADVYDALTSKRVYKEAFTHTIAHSIIVKDSGTHFDPAVVDAYLQCEKSFVEIRSKYQDVEMALAA